MKRVIIVSIIIISYILVCSSCGHLLDYISNESEQRKIADEILRCFNESNNNALKSLFCEYTKESFNLDEQIQKAMDFLQGNILSYDSEKKIEGGSSGSYREGRLVKNSTSGFIENILTDTENHYYICFYNYLVNEEDEKKVGISKLVIGIGARPDGGERTVVIGELIE